MAGLVAANAGSGLMGLSLQQRVGHEIDLLLIDVMSKPIGVAHLESREQADRLRNLAQQRAVLIQPAVPFLRLVSVIVGLLVTELLLAGVSGVLALVPLAVLPLLVGGAFAEVGQQRHLRETAEARRRMEHLLRLSTRAESAKELRIYNLAEHFAESYQQAAAELRRRGRRVLARQMAVMLPATGLAAFGFGAALLYVGRLASEHHTSGVQLFVVFFLVSSVISQLLGAAQAVQSATRLTSLARTLTKLARDAEAADVPVGTARVPDRVSQGIALRDVTFRYPGATSPALESVDLVIPAGTTLAVVGDNGAGKTTLTKLLTRLYEPEAGEITIDGTPLAELPPEEWRHRTTSCLQDFMRFEFLLRETVGLGDLTALDDLAAVTCAVDEAGATGVVVDVPDGMAAPLGSSLPDGAELSGGQWQKLALARSFMRQLPLLVILDEPTASLDATAEAELFTRFVAATARLREATGAVTVLVSHRFSTVRQADVIVVLRDGQLAEHGTHDELMALGGEYAAAFSVQARAFASVAASPAGFESSGEASQLAAVVDPHD
jgi:ATP-binding cassette subfamily B protein